MTNVAQTGVPNAGSSTDSAARWRWRWLPVATVLSVLVFVWYVAAFGLNAPRALQSLEQAGHETDIGNLLSAAWSMSRPVLAAPHQIIGELVEEITAANVSSPRNLLYHAAVTIETAVVGFAIAVLFGIVLGSAIVRISFLGRAALPWVIGAQAVPVLATAPVIIVAMGQLGFEGLLPKALIAALGAFFPVVIASVTGLRSPDRLQLDLMATYSTGPRAVFSKLRWPAALPYLLPSLKVAAALAIVGAIVSELPTGAQAGLGARLLIGSYNGLILMMWAVLVMSALLAVVSVALVGLAERSVVARRGGRL